MQPTPEQLDTDLCLPKLVPCYDLTDVLASIFLLLPPPPEGAAVQGARIAAAATAGGGGGSARLAAAAAGVDPEVQVPRDPSPQYSVLGQGYNLFEGAGRRAAASWVSSACARAAGRGAAPLCQHRRAPTACPPARPPAPATTRPSLEQASR